MNKNIKNALFIAAILTLPFLTMAQTPPHPNNGNNPGMGNTPVGGAVPIDGGLSILLMLGAGYGARKAYQVKK